MELEDDSSVGTICNVLLGDVDIDRTGVCRPLDRNTCSVEEGTYTGAIVFE